MAAKARLLVIDDDPLVLNLIGMLLQKDGYEVLTASDGPRGLEIALDKNPRAIILDVKMPGMDGFEVCRSLRETTDAVIMFVSVKGESGDIARGMALGADDYLVKPYTYQELASRLKSCLRRKAAGKPPLALKASSEMLLLTDPERRLVFVHGREVQLTPTEFDVLRYFAHHPGRVLTTEAILANVWGSCDGSGRAVKQVIHRLRAKIEPDPENPRHLITVRGSGYFFEGEGAP